MEASKTPATERASTEGLAESYDYVVVGGGTAGLVVASRLTEDQDVTVLVLEAGADRLDDNRITTPGLALMTWDNPDFDWRFMTTPQVSFNAASPFSVLKIVLTLCSH